MCGIVPPGMNGIYETNHKNSFLMHPVKIRLKFGQPIPAKTLSTLTIQELQILTCSKIIELLDRKVV